MPQIHWPEVVVTWAPFEKQNVEVHILEMANLSGFATWEFTAMEDLKIHESRYFFLTEDSGRSRKQKFGLFSMGKTLYKKIL